MKKKSMIKIISLMLTVIILLGTFVIPSSALSLKCGINPYLILSKWHLCRLVECETPTCTENGYVKYKCFFCKYTKTVEKTAYGHSLVENETINPTCETDGYTVYNCENCDYIENAVISKTGHSIIENETVQATCIQNGYIEYKCEWCDYTDIIFISASGHSEVLTEAVQPTCTEDGYTYSSYCDICNEIIKEKSIIPAVGHSYESVIVKATPEKDGLNKIVCSVCGDSTEEKISKPAKIEFGDYTGLVKPTVTVYDEDGNCIDKSNYTVTYPYIYVGGIKVNLNKAVVTFVGDKYEGSLEDYYTIKSSERYPITVESKGPQSIEIYFKASADASGYQIQYSTDPEYLSDDTKIITDRLSTALGSVKTITHNLDNLPLADIYYVRVRICYGYEQKYESWENFTDEMKK